MTNYIFKAADIHNQYMKTELEIYKNYQKHTIYEESVEFLLPFMINITALYAYSAQGNPITASVIDKVFNTFGILSVNAYIGIAHNYTALHHEIQRGIYIVSEV
jgi:hypothetical protein